MSSKGTILEEIIDHKKRAVSIAKQELSLEDIESQQGCPSPRPFISPLRSALANQEPAVIAEIKKASPSKGLIRSDFNPREHAKDYEVSGTCLSVLTDARYFKGLMILIEVKQASLLPILRKDFIIDPYQIAQSKLMEQIVFCLSLQHCLGRNSRNWLLMLIKFLLMY